jgi:integrase
MLTLSPQHRRPIKTTVDVDLDGRTPTISRSVRDVDSVLIEGDTKTHEPRTIGLDASLVALLRHQRVAQNEWRLKVGPDWVDRDLVFPGPDGDYLKPGTLSQRFDRLIASAGLPRIRFHDLRHTHATLLVESGKDAKIVSQRLGHSTVAFTLDRYVKPSLQAHIDAADDFARWLGRRTR